MGVRRCPRRFELIKRDIAMSGPNVADDKARHLKTALASIFLALGACVLVFPSQVEQLVLNPTYVVGTLSSAVAFACFGAQAVLTGTVILTARFTARTFLVFGLVGSVPFFVFNYYFYFVAPVFSKWMLLDFLGNVGILFCGVYGWRILSRAEDDARS